MLPAESRYQDGTYLLDNPDWHDEEAPWKARNIRDIVVRNRIAFATAVEVGCGNGAILQTLAAFFPQASLVGYDISQAASTFWKNDTDRLKRIHGDFLATTGTYDLMLLIDVFEHVEDYFGFLRALAPRARHFVFNIPLEINLYSLLRDLQIVSRRKVGHLHYFSRATAFATLEDTGYRILDWSLLDYSKEPQRGRVSLPTRLLNVARHTSCRLSPDLSAKLFGGYSALVLCERRE